MQGSVVVVRLRGHANYQDTSAPVDDALDMPPRLTRKYTLPCHPE